jgi:hypothetical protein
MTGKRIIKDLIHNKTLQIEASLLPISEENILKSLGVPADKADSFLIDKIKESIEIGLNISTPCASYTVIPNPEFTKNPGVMNLAGKILHINNIVTAALEKSTEIAIFIGTCGKKVENYAKQLMKEGNSLEGYILDLVGSEIAENIAGFIHKAISSDMAVSGMKVTNRYSPGYCSWPVSDQQQLFQLIGQNNCGVQLTPTSLMLPIKSVSGIIGVGRTVENAGYTCDICDTSNCIYRDQKLNN